MLNVIKKYNRKHQPTQTNSKLLAGIKRIKIEMTLTNWKISLI